MSYRHNNQERASLWLLLYLYVYWKILTVQWLLWYAKPALYLTASAALLFWKGRLYAIINSLFDLFIKKLWRTPGACLFLSAILRLQYTFGSAIFFKFGFLGQNSGRRIISNFWKKILKKAEYWRRNGGFTFSPEVKVYLLIDSPMVRMQSTEMNWLLSWSALLFWLPSIFGIRRVSIKL